MSAPNTAERGVDEGRGTEIADKLNWLRAGVMGANDGIISTAAMVIGVAGAAVSNAALLAAGVAAVIAGAMSMAVGEFVSVSSQRDSQRAELEHERTELAEDPASELEQLTQLIQAQGIDRSLAHQVALQLTERDPLTAHARLELGIDPKALTTPWHAALASMLAFVLGGVIPLAAILSSPRASAVAVTAVAVIAALAITGTASAHLGNAPKLRAVFRVVGGGILAMAITYGIGSVIGARV
ncbi:MAG: VIT family protein [Nitrococcus sp.]|nr:VIT family protein [Nitrococcus sp.]